MSVQVRRRREAASFLQTYVGAQGELLVDTTNNRVQVHDGVTAGGWPAARLADVIGRTAVADAAYAAKSTDRTIAVTALTAPRTITLPPASTYPTGTQLLIVDESGACSLSFALAVAPSGSDVVDGSGSAVLNTPFAFLALTSNGAGRWTIVDFAGASMAQLTNRNAIINGNFAINQRVYATGTALAANAYAHDRWKAGSGGGTYTFAQGVPDSIATITAGSLVQVVEGANIPAATMWLTWAGTASARVYQGSAASQTSPAYAAGTAANVSGTTVNILAVTGLTVGSNTTVEFSGGTIGLVQLEAALPGAGPTRFERRNIGTELALCQRYFWKTYASGDPAGTKYPSTGSSVFSNGVFITQSYAPFSPFVFPVAMRATPTLSFFSPVSGAAGMAYSQQAGDVPMGANLSGVAFQGYINNKSLNSGDYIYLHCTANAEI